MNRQLFIGLGSFVLILIGIAALAPRKPSMLRGRRRREKIPGGKAAGMFPDAFDPAELRVGTEIELEHTPNRSTAREIAMDHLAEDAAYYSKLCRWHPEPPCRML